MADTVIVIEDETVVTVEVGTQGPQGPAGAAGADGAIGPAANSGVVSIPSGAACSIDYATNGHVFKFTANQDFTISLSNLPTSGAWGVVLVLTNGGAYAITYPADWMEAGGTALAFTTAGEDRVLITGEGQDATTVVVSVTQADVK